MVWDLTYKGREYACSAIRSDPTTSLQVVLLDTRRPPING